MHIYFIQHVISELKGESILTGDSLSQLKEKTKILIIDDTDFALLSALQNYEFNIKQKKDISLLSDAEAYDVILCDIRGVGKFLESRYEGANLIKELKIKYPSKFVVAYTADDYDASFQPYLLYADDIVAKGSFDIEDWVALLSRVLCDNANPEKQWNKTRTALLEAGVSTVDVAKYESQYVKAIKSRSFDSIRRLYSNKKNTGAEIMLELSSSVIAKVLTKVID